MASFTTERGLIDGAFSDTYCNRDDIDFVS